MKESEPTIESKPKEMPDFDFDFDFEDKVEEKKESQRTANDDHENDEEKPYFHSIYEGISKDVGPKSANIDTKKIIEGLKTHHTVKRTEREAKTHSHSLQESIQETLEELHRHEEEWKELHDLQHEVSQRIADKEKEIEEDLEVFKKLIRKLTYTKMASEEEAFKLSNGLYIRSISQLITVLPGMSDETFNSHLREGHNDFAEWIRTVFHDEQLSSQASKCNSRKELYVVLKKSIVNEGA
ncbi:MAG: hypothetical protein ACMXYL_03245 [Candidatus Woesearchaeota archaeon]